MSTAALRFQPAPWSPSNNSARLVQLDVPAVSAPTGRKKKSRDLTKAITLRPAEVFALYGIPSSTLCGLCKNPDPERRLPSKLIPGRMGHKGLRLIEHVVLRAWLAKWECN